MIWPFGRKKNKKQGPFDDHAMATTSVHRDMTMPSFEGSTSGSPSRKSSRKDSKRSKRSLSRKASSTHQSTSKDPEKVEDIPAVPPLPQLSVKKRNVLSEKINSSGRDATRDPNLTKLNTDHGGESHYYRQNPMSATSLQPDNFTAIPIGPPTLRNKRSENETNLPRRKSSKRKAEDRAREKEIRAMSPTPVDIPKVPNLPGGDVFNRGSRTNISGRPPSGASTNLPDSLHSSMSVAIDQHSFRVSAFDALSPRPTIRYSQNPRFSNASWGPSRTPTKKEKQPAIPEETVQAKKRVEELADDLDAGTIRELMERDRRRREKARKHDEERLQRRLQRRADKQREEERRETEASAAVTELKANSETASPISPFRDNATKPASWLRDPSKERLPSQDPFVDPSTDVPISKLEEASPISEKDEPVIETAKAVRLSAASMSPPASPIEQLQPPPSMGMLTHLNTSSTPSIPEQGELEHRGSDTSGQFSRDWKQIFRRSATRQAKRDSAERLQAGPTPFTNTSRDSLQPQPLQPIQFARLSHPRSGTSMRTQSIFREDLPETPSSPPLSRVQSPDLRPPGESPTLGQVIPERSKKADDVSEQRLSDIHPAYREEIALSRHQSVTSPTLSQSLASVDSEGSWLTGRPVKRLSGPQMSSLRGSAGSLQKQLQDLRNSGEKLDITSEPRQQPRTSDEREKDVDDDSRKPSYLLSGVTVNEDSDDESALPSRQSAFFSPVEDEPATTWHGGSMARHPTIVRQAPAQRARSREGLLNEFANATPEEVHSTAIVEKPEPKTSPQAAQLPTPNSDSSMSPTGDSPIGPDAQHGRSFIERAKSVDLGKGHVRHISAGSAKLLDLPSKRLSGTSSAAGSNSPLPSPRIERRDVP